MLSYFMFTHLMFQWEIAGTYEIFVKINNNSGTYIHVFLDHKTSLHFIWLHKKNSRTWKQCDVSTRIWCETKRGIRKSTTIPTLMDNSGLRVFTSSPHSHMQWKEVIRPRMSHFCIWGLLIIMVYVIISTITIDWALVL